MRAWLAARVVAAFAALAMGSWPVQAEKISDVRGTKHNLSSSGTGTVRATTETQVCVFCHTPHGVTMDGSPLAPVAPLWNRRLSNETYTVYTSSTLDANVIQGQLDQPGGSSKLCLSCHDGTLAIGQVNVLNGQGSFTTPGTVSVSMTGTDSSADGPKDVVGGMPDHLGKTSGFTRDLGIDLRNDHPISLTFTTELANRDGELRVVDAAQKWPGDGSIIGVRASGYRPALPLEATGLLGKGQVQCGTCHDPHLRETQEATVGNQKFLRQNRFQVGTPTGIYTATNDLICISCHDKNAGFGSWAYSAHAVPLVANEVYKSAAAATRDFPGGIQVWQAACMNCHDTHAVQGTRRLLREGTDGPIANGVRQGGNPALEETCYQCHTTTGESILTLGSPSTVPDIKTDFTTAGNKRMPITGTEVHDISSNFSDGMIDCTGIGNTQQCGKDFLEPRTLLGYSGNLGNRHAECTDCHNPHRVIKYQNGLPGPLAAVVFNDTGLSRAGTHRHEDASGYTHTNIISGVLRGSWGVEPLYPSNSFHDMPSDFLIKRGDPGNSTSALVSDSYVTREYQICLKCHSNYGYTDDNAYPDGNTRPQLGGIGLTSVNRTNDPRAHTRYTNQAKEFNAPNAHLGAPGNLGADGGADAAYNSNNNRSWHPVMKETGRTTAIRGAGSTAWRTPWSNDVGSQTMFCSDCHGSNTAAGTVMPSGNTNTNENGNPWGPHGSANDFILKGLWNAATDGGQTNALCFKCHEQQTYAPTSGGGGNTGFDTGRGDGHYVHSARDRMSRTRCNWCHTAVPHGWKNMALLVNLNDVGAEAGQTGSKEVSINASGAVYSQGPYYRNAKLKVRNFRSSGQWSDTDCGSAGKATADRIAASNGNTTNTTGSGRDWMRSTCDNPP